MHISLQFPSCKESNISHGGHFAALNFLPSSVNRPEVNRALKLIHLHCDWVIRPALRMSFPSRYHCRHDRKSKTTGTTGRKNWKRGRLTLGLRQGETSSVCFHRVKDNMFHNSQRASYQVRLLQPDLTFQRTERGFSECVGPYFLWINKNCKVPAIKCYYLKSILHASVTHELGYLAAPGCLPYCSFS